MPRRVPDFPDILNSWNYISSIGSGITLISFFLVIDIPDPIHEFYIWNIYSCTLLVIVNLLSTPNQT